MLFKKKRKKKRNYIKINQKQKQRKPTAFSDIYIYLKINVIKLYKTNIC